MIPIQSLHNLAQTLMTVVLLIPHVLMIFHLLLLIERQRHKTVDRFREMHESWCVFLFHLERNLRVGVGDNLRGEGFGGCHDFWYACVHDKQRQPLSP